MKWFQIIYAGDNVVRVTLSGIVSISFSVESNKVKIMRVDFIKNAYWYAVIEAVRIANLTNKKNKERIYIED